MEIKYSAIATVRNERIGTLFKLILEKKGIPVRVEPNMRLGLLEGSGAAEQAFDVLVRAADVERAVDILQSRTTQEFYVGD